MYRADLIVEAMEKQGKTNESLAQETGLSHATVSAVRNGNQQVKLETLKVIAEALSLSMGDLFKPKRGQAKTSPATV